jgi:hypothetical protein
MSPPLFLGLETTDRSSKILNHDLVQAHDPSKKICINSQNRKSNSVHTNLMAFCLTFWSDDVQSFFHLYSNIMKYKLSYTHQIQFFQLEVKY